MNKRENIMPVYLPLKKSKNPCIGLINEDGFIIYYNSTKSLLSFIHQNGVCVLLFDSTK